MGLSIVKLSLCALCVYLLVFLDFNGVVGARVHFDEFVGTKRAVAGSAGFSNYRHQYHVISGGQYKRKEGHAFNDFQKRSNVTSFREETRIFSTGALRSLKDQERPRPNQGSGPKHN